MDQPEATTLNRGYSLLRAIRPLQWFKNGLIFLPLCMAHEVRDTHKLALTALAFVAFSLTASAGYVVNDICDIEADRAHPRKCRRPFASGEVSVAAGYVAAILMLAGAGVIGTGLLGGLFAGLLGIYLLSTLAYSLVLKRLLMVDVVALAGLYTLRLIAGGVAGSVPLSPWLLALSMFLFLSLAFVKRYSELLLQDDSQGQLKGRSYCPSDIAIIESVGPTSGYMAVLVLMLYINTGVKPELYRYPQFLWAICPVFLYWITRVWFLARRKKLLDDPLLFSLRDRQSWIALGLTLALAWLAS